MPPKILKQAPVQFACFHSLFLHILGALETLHGWPSQFFFQSHLDNFTQGEQGSSKSKCTVSDAVLQTEDHAASSGAVTAEFEEIAFFFLAINPWRKGTSPVEHMHMQAPLYRVKCCLVYSLTSQSVANAAKCMGALTLGAVANNQPMTTSLFSLCAFKTGAPSSNSCCQGSMLLVRLHSLGTHIFRQPAVTHGLLQGPWKLHTGKLGGQPLT